MVGASCQRCVQVTVVVVSAVTVLLWCGNTALAGVIGNQGIVAILPLAVFFGTGILDKDDFNSFLWHVVMLAQARPHSAPRTCHAILKLLHHLSQVHDTQDLDRRCVGTLLKAVLCVAIIARSCGTSL